MQQENEITFVNIGNLWIKRGLNIVGPAFLSIKNGKIRSFGCMDEPRPRGRTVDLEGRAVIPGLVECHTHLVFGGNRADEFGQRAGGVTYEDIARQGGGIMATVAATRGAAEEDLFESGMQRLDRFMSVGVTTIEVKSGYGLDFETEMKMLRVIRQLNDAHPLDVRATLLAHIPDGPERGVMVNEIARKWIPEVVKQGLATQFDVFCDDIAFDARESMLLLRAAKDAGLGLRVHAEQLSHTGISGQAARIGALSADHLDHAEEDDLTAMADFGTIAVLLPGCGISMGILDLPRIEQFREKGILVALSTDYNPGSSVTTNLPLMGSLAVAYMGFSYEDAMAGVTEYPADALGLDDAGTLETGKKADFVVQDTADWRDIFYEYATPHVRRVYKSGEVIYEACGSGHGRSG